MTPLEKFGLFMMHNTILFVILFGFGATFSQSLIILVPFLLGYAVFMRGGEKVAK